QGGKEATNTVVAKCRLEVVEDQQSISAKEIPLGRGGNGRSNRPTRELGIEAGEGRAPEVRDRGPTRATNPQKTPLAASPPEEEIDRLGSQRRLVNTTWNYQRRHAPLAQVIGGPGKVRGAAGGVLRLGEETAAQIEGRGR